jgi:hypothetical protein
VGLSRGAAEFDAFVEDGVRGDAIHVQQLEGAHAQGEGYGFGKALVGTGEEFADAGVEGDLPTEDTHDESGGEVAIFGSERVSNRGVEEFVAVAFVGGNKG